MRMSLRFCTVTVGLLISWLMLSVPAAAQQPVPPETYTLDERGVDMVSGAFNYAVTDISVGDPADGGLSHGRIYTQGGWRDQTAGTIDIAGATYTVSLGGESEIFTLSQGAFVPRTQRGFTLVQAGANYTFTTPSGAVGQFSTTYADAVSDYRANGGYLTTLTRPDGSILTNHYATAPVCVEIDPNTGECIRYGTALRLQSVANNRGYQIHYEYDSDDPDTGLYTYRTAATAINAAVDYCDPLASACAALTRTWPRVAYDNPVPLQVTDESGRVTTYSYGLGGLTGIRLPGQATDQVSITYGGAFGGVYAVQSITDASGIWGYTYATAGNQRTVVSTGPLGQGRTVVSDLTLGRATSVTNALNQTTSYQYNSERRVSRVTRPEGDYTTYGYDVRGNVIEVRDVAKSGSGLADIVTTADYPDTCTDPGISIRNCNRPLWTRDARGAQTDYVFSDVHGGPVMITPPAPVPAAVRPQQRFAYGQFNAWYKVSANAITASPTAVWRPTSVAACNINTTCAGTADETLTTVAYGTPGVANNLQPTATTTAAGNGSVSSSLAMTYDANGDVATLDGPIPGAGDTSVFFYNSSRWPLGGIGPDPDGGGPLLNRAARTTYNSDGTVSLSEAGTTVGQSLSAWNAFSTLQQQVATYDAYLRPTISRFTAAGTIWSLVQINYDAAGRPDCVTQRMNPALFASPSGSVCAPSTEGAFGSDRIAQIAYDVLSRPLSVTSGVGTSDTLTEQTTYTTNGRQAAVTDGNGNRSTMIYDGFDRMIRLEYPSATIGSGVSNPADYQGYGYDANGNVTTYRTRNNQVFTSTFDALNRVTSVVQSGSAINVGTLSYTYDLFDRPLTASVGAIAASVSPPILASPAASTTMTYDALGRQLTETDSVLGQSVMQYDAAGRRTQMTWPGGFAVTYAYDLTDAMTQIAGGGVTYAAYGYDNLGRRAQVTRPNGITTTYGFDPASRLTSLVHAFPSASNNLTLTYAHNPAGQIVSRTPSNATYDFPSPSSGTTTYPINGLNQTGLNGTGVLPYDAKGNLQGDGTRGYTYDQANRMRSVFVGSTTTATLIYDALGRLARLEGTQGARYLYGGVEITGIAPATGSTALINRIVRGPWPDEVVATVPNSGSPTWLLADELGSTIALTIDTGAVAGTLAYDEYGNPRSGNAGRFQYTGQMWLPDAQAYHYKARVYHPGLGRFMQTDPIGYGAGLNLYAYVGGDPANWTDPLGLQSVTICSNNGPTGEWDGGPIDNCGPSELTPNGGGGSWGNVLSGSLWSLVRGSGGLGPQTGLSVSFSRDRTIGSYFEAQGYEVLQEVGYDDMPDSWQCTAASYGRLIGYASNAPTALFAGRQLAASTLATAGLPVTALEVQRGAASRILGLASIVGGVASYSLATLSGDTAGARDAAVGVVAPISATNMYAGPGLAASYGYHSGLSVPPQCSSQ